jgi:hypothetical protein
MMSDLNYAILIMAHLKLSLLARIRTIGNIRLFSQKPREFLYNCFVSFESIVSSLRSCGPLAYFDNERTKQLLYALDDHVWSTKINDLEESVDFANLETEKLFSKLKSHKLSRKDRHNYDASRTSKLVITSVRVGGHDANPTNTTVSSTFEFVLSSLVVASDEQYESIPDDEIALLGRKFRAFHKFCKESRSPRGCFECGDTTHFIADSPKRKRLDSSNKYDYTKQNDYNKGDEKKKHRFRERRRSSRKLCPERVLPSATSTSLVMTPPAQRRMRRSSVGKATSPAFAS